MLRSRCAYEDTFLQTLRYRRISLSQNVRGDWPIADGALFS